jgi:hypothetical protein
MATTTTATTTAVKCAECGRTLTNLRSIAARRGPTCRARVAQAIATATTNGKLAAYQPAQVAKAVEVVELAAIARVRRSTAWVVVSSHGNATYTVDIHTRTCTCPAGDHGRRCYHLAAAEILAAA